MDSKFTNPIKAGIFDEEGNPFTLVNPLPSEIANFPSDFPLPAAQHSSLNQEATQELIRLLLVSLDSKDFSTETTLAALLSAFNLEDFATETTLNNFLTAFNNEDFAQEATLELVRLLLVSLDNKDFSTETTLAALLAAFNTEDFATETTLDAFKAAFDNRDLATETTLELVRLLLISLDAKFNSLGQKTSVASAPVVLSTEQEVILSAIRTAVENLDLDIEDIATEATLAAFRTDFNARDLATETKQDNIISELQTINATDFATETTLSGLNTKFNSLGQKTMTGSVPVVISSDQSNIDVNLNDDTGTPFSESNPLEVAPMSEFVSEKFNSLELTYVAAGNGQGEIETITYKNDTTTVAVLTLGYDSSNRLISIVRS